MQFLPWLAAGAVVQDYLRGHVITVCIFTFDKNPDHVFGLVTQVVGADGLN